MTGWETPCAPCKTPPGQTYPSFGACHPSVPPACHANSRGTELLLRVPPVPTSKGSWDYASNVECAINVGAPAQARLSRHNWLGEGGGGGGAHGCAQYVPSVTARMVKYGNRSHSL